MIEMYLSFFVLAVFVFIMGYITLYSLAKVGELETKVKELEFKVGQVKP